MLWFNFTMDYRALVAPNLMPTHTQVLPTNLELNLPPAFPRATNKVYPIKQATPQAHNTEVCFTIYILKLGIEIYKIGHPIMYSHSSPAWSKADPKHKGWKHKYYKLRNNGNPSLPRFGSYSTGPKWSRAQLLGWKSTENSIFSWASKFQSKQS